MAHASFTARMADGIAARAVRVVLAGEGDIGLAHLGGRRRRVHPEHVVEAHAAARLVHRIGRATTVAGATRPVG